MRRLALTMFSAAAIGWVFTPSISGAVDPASCATILASGERLACYDGIFRAADEADTMLSACEEALKRSLKAPATYQRARVTSSREEMTIEAYKDVELIRIRDNFDADTAVTHRLKLIDQVDRMRADGAQPTVITKLIEYDAQNGFGALLRGAAVCTFVSQDGKDSGATASTVRVENIK